MPYCEPCEKYHAPTTLTETGDCPECGTHLDSAVATGGDEVDQAGAPWHFKILIVVLVAYLGFRTVQMISWLF